MTDVSISRRVFMKVGFAAAGVFAASGVLSAYSSSNEGNTHASTTDASEQQVQGNSASANEADTGDWQDGKRFSSGASDDEVACSSCVLAGVLERVFFCTGTDEKNLAVLRSYPDEMQAVVRERLGKDAPGAKSIPSILLGNLLLFTVLFSVLGVAVKSVSPFSGYLEAFWYFLLLGEGLGLFDLVVIDLLWWRSTRRIRFSYLPDAAPYQDPSKHIGSFVRGIPLFAAVAALTAAVVTLL